MEHTENQTGHAFSQSDYTKPVLISDLPEATRSKSDKSDYWKAEKYFPALFESIGLDNVAMTMSLSSMEGGFDITGVPSFPSYVPSECSDEPKIMQETEISRNDSFPDCSTTALVPAMLSPSSDHMTFLERTQNLLSLFVARLSREFIFAGPFVEEAEDRLPNVKSRTVAVSL